MSSYLIKFNYVFFLTPTAHTPRHFCPCQRETINEKLGRKVLNFISDSGASESPFSLRNGDEDEEQVEKLITNRNVKRLH
jgi:hypothetical protein